MARHESDREDLMQEATALRERAEFRVPGEADTVIAGYRRNGSLSIFFGPDPCFHFDSQRRLRRAFADGQLYRSEGSTLARLTRIRREDAVELQRHDLTRDELDDFLARSTTRLQHLHNALQRKTSVCTRVTPQQTDLQSRLEASLAEMLRHTLTLAPAIRPGR